MTLTGQFVFEEARVPFTTDTSPFLEETEIVTLGRKRLVITGVMHKGVIQRCFGVGTALSTYSKRMVRKRSARGNVGESREGRRLTRKRR